MRTPPHLLRIALPPRGAALLAACLAACLGGCGEPGMEGGRPLAQAPLEIDVTAHDYVWHVRYPGPDGRLGTPDDVHSTRDVHVPTGIPTRLKLHSKDFIYTLHLPRQGKREVAIPDLDFELFFTEEDEGEYPLRGDQMCGFSHKSLIGRLVVEPEAAFWQALERIQREQRP